MPDSPIINGIRPSTEEVTDVNGATVAAQHVQRMLLAISPTDGDAIDLPGDPTYGLGVDVKRLPNISAPLASPVGVRLSDGSGAMGTTAGRLHVDDGGQSLTVDSPKLDAIASSVAAGAFAYAAGTAAGTVDVPAGARVKRVSVIAGSAGAATVTIAGGATITIPAGGSFDEQLPGDVATGSDVVIGGTVSSYYVGWVA